MKNIELALERRSDDDIEKINIIELNYGGAIIPWGYCKLGLRKIDIMAEKANGMTNGANITAKKANGLTKEVNITAKKANGVTKEVKEIEAKKANWMARTGERTKNNSGAKKAKLITKRNI